jgi:hypothetical protein
MNPLRIFPGFAMAAGLAMLLAAQAAHAQAVGPSPVAGQTLFLFSFIGSGPSTVTCDEETGDCTSTFSGIANGSAIGLKATVSSSFTWNVEEGGIVSNDQICYLAAGTGTVVTKKKGQLTFSQVGLLCGPLDGFTPADFNGAFVVTGGTGRFAKSVGGGGATASSDASGFVLLFAEGSLTWKGQAPPAG